MSWIGNTTTLPNDVFKHYVDGLPNIVTLDAINMVCGKQLCIVYSYLLLILHVNCVINCQSIIVVNGL